LDRERYMVMEGDLAQRAQRIAELEAMVLQRQTEME
jgi:hypothetical protein